MPDLHPDSPARREGRPSLDQRASPARRQQPTSHAHAPPGRTPPQRHEADAAGVQRHQVQSLSLAGRWPAAAPGRQTLRVTLTLLPRSRTGQNQGRGTFPATGRALNRQPCQRPPPCETTPANSSAANIQIAKPLPARPSPNIGPESPANPSTSRTSVAANSLGREAREGEVVATRPAPPSRACGTSRGTKGVTQGLRDIVNSAIARGPADRYSSAAAFDAALGGRMLPAREWRRTVPHPEARAVLHRHEGKLTR